MSSHLKFRFGFLFFLFFSISVFAQTKDSPREGKQKLFQAFQYRNVGPNRGGRVTTVEGVASIPGTYYMGSSGGGVWKTKDYGINWKNISDGYFSTPSIGAIRVVPSNPDIVYVGTGSDGIRSNVITGKGVYKSENGGKSWEHIGLEKVGQIGALEIHPDQPDIVFVAAIGQAFQPNKERGIYRSLNGGKDWQHVLYLADTIGAVDIEFAPSNPNILYASMWRAERKPWTIISGGEKAGGIYKSEDGGSNWTKLSQGLPGGLIGKIDLAVSPADPNRLYALVEAPKGEGGLYRSDNMGESFSLISTNTAIINRPFYYCNIEANPLNANSLYVMAGRFLHSTDGGVSWKNLRPPHGDNHDIWINPNDTLEFIQSNDGGANITQNGGISWSTQHNQPTAELYQVEVDDQYPYWLYAGQQDNSTIAVPSLPPYNAPSGATGFWLSVGGCETGPAVPKPGNPDIIYSNCKGRFGVYDKRTGQEKQYYVGATNIYSHNPKDLKYRFQRVSPIHVSPHNPDVVYHASQYLHKTINDGVTWETISPDLTAFEADKQVNSGSPITRDITGEEYYSSIYSIRESILREGLIWVGANDGPVHVTRNGGTDWENVSPEDLPPGGRVDCVEPSPHKEEKAYIAVLRYQLGDWHPYIYKTGDYGKNWELLTTGTNGIPNDFPTRVIREDPDKEGLLYAGTEFGIFISFNDGLNWVPFQQNLPVTPVTDIKIFRNNLILSTMGRSFWIMDNVTALYDLESHKNIQEAVLFKPLDTYRFRYRGTGSNSIPEYPSPSVIIDYYLHDKFDQVIKLEILNKDKNVIRSYMSQQKEETGEENEMMAYYRRNMASTRLTNHAGTNRFRWDMRHHGPWDKSERRRSSGGPDASPGTYYVRLSVNGTSYTQNFELMMDPRLEETMVCLDDLLLKEELAIQIRDLVSLAKKSAYLIDEKRKELKEQIDANNKKKNKYLSEDENLAQIQSEFVTAEGPYMTPMLLDQLSYLSSMLGRADQVPGKDAYERYIELKNRYEEIIFSKVYKDLSD